jgi:hypothetical protein
VQLPLVFCSAADGTNVVKVWRPFCGWEARSVEVVHVRCVAVFDCCVQMFGDAIDAAIQYKANPPPDFIEDVLRVDDYFQAKEERTKAEQAQAAAAAKAKAKAEAEAAEATAKAAAEQAKQKADFERAQKMQEELANRAKTAGAGAKKK